MHYSIVGYHKLLIHLHNDIKSYYVVSLADVKFMFIVKQLSHTTLSVTHLSMTIIVIKMCINAARMM